MKVSLFLGAGASADYPMPTTRGLKEDLAKKHAEDEKVGGTGGGEKDVWSDLLSDSNDLDIEHVLLLADTVDRLKKTEHGRRLVGGSGLLGRQLEEAVKIGKTARREVYRQYAWNHDFDEVAAGLLGPLVKMAMAMNGDGHVAVFTTNYDRAVEEFCEGAELPVRDGFRLDKTERRVWRGEFGADGGKAGEQGGPRAVRLYKLHGSLDWKHDAKHGVLKTDYDGASEGNNYKDILIHPSLADKGDDIASEPYRTIRDSFRRELESSDACVAVGFSFRDPHIADEFRKFAEQRDNILIVVGPDAYEDVNRRILGREPPDGDGPPDTGVPRMTSAGTGDRKIRRAAVIRQKLTIETSYEIAARARSAIEDDHRLLPAHTLGKCRCGQKLTIDDMEGHIAKNHARKGARRASLLKIVAHTTGAPWMFAHAKPGATFGDLVRLLQEKLMPQYRADPPRRVVGFGTQPNSKMPDLDRELPEAPGSEVTAWCDDMGGIQVTAAGTVGYGALSDPVGALAVGENLPFG